MKKHLINFSLYLLPCVVCFVLGCNERTPPSVQTVHRSESPQRLVSTVPGITEILFDIGLGDRIVGDSKFTTHPPETEKIEKIGGLCDPQCGPYDTQWDQIDRLKPDLVLIRSENETFRARCQELGIETLAVDHRSMEGMLASYDLIGERFGSNVMAAAQERKAALESKLEDIRTRAAAFPPVRVLVCIDRTHGSGQIQNLFVAGTSPFFQDVIRWAGGINVAETIGTAFPNIAVEAVAAMNPDVIVDVVINNGTPLETSDDDLIGDWKTLGDEVNAVKSGRIYVITEDYATNPGPRTPLFVEKLSEFLHGEQREHGGEPVIDNRR
jgi:iron complex transport system substrate-binding protein